MEVTSKTLYSEFAPFEQFATQESLQELKRAAEQLYGNCYGLTVDEFWGIVNGDFSYIGITPETRESEPTVYQVYWIKRFNDFTQEIANACKRMTIKATPEQEQAANGCVKIEPMEQMLIFVRSYFGLPSFKAAGLITMGEYITARKDDYNQKRTQRNWEDIQRRKLKRNKR